MKVTEAIEILDHLITISSHMPNPDHWDAIKLGIEGLKRLQTYRERKYYYARTLLPGETTEEEPKRR